MRICPSLLLAIALAALAGCTRFPALEDTVLPELKNADYARLVPLGTLETSTDSLTVDPVQTQAQLNARLAGLRARAGGLRGSILTGVEKQRLQQGLQ